MMSADDGRDISKLEDKTGQGLFPSVYVGWRMEDQYAEGKAAAASEVETHSAHSVTAGSTSLVEGNDGMVHSMLED